MKDLDFPACLLFEIYKAGENNGRMFLKESGPLDEEGSRKDFERICAKYIRMMEASHMLQTLNVNSPTDLREKYQQEAEESGLIDYLFSKI